jgi:hypothetical protein
MIEARVSVDELPTATPVARDAAVLADEPAPVARVRARHSTRRRAFCPLCGREQMDKPVSEVGSPEAALCVGRCAVAWQVLTALRASESTSDQVAARRRAEWDARGANEPTLSEVLLARWRAGDWAVAPEDLLRRLETSTA